MPHSRERDRVFVSYSHLDSEWLDRMRVVLDPDVRNGRMQYFDDRELEPGDPWYQEITEAIDHAKIAVLLVSPNFFASRFIAEDELPRILRAVNDGLTILWIPLSGKFYGPDAIPGSEKLADRQAVWDASQTLDSLAEESRTARLLDLCRRINAHMVTRIPFNMPFGTLGDSFKGREEELRRLDEQLKLRGASAILQPRAISGLGGIGKTRLTIEYAHRHRDEFTALLFVSANTPADLEANLARLCADDKALDLPEFRRAPQAEQYAAVVRWLSQNTGWLLILDNVDTEEALDAVQNLAASLHGGHILITSRLTGWGGSVRTISLDVIPLDDAVALLLQKANEGGRQPRPDDAEKARALATELGCLPLALTHAGAYVRWGNKTFDRYLGEFDKALAFHKKGVIEYDPDPGTDRAAKTVATTYFLSIDLLGPGEKSLLRAASILAPVPIPVAMFEDCADEYKALVKLWCDESGDAVVERDAGDALSELANYSLVERGVDSFSIHRMERLVLSHRIPADSFPKWVESTRTVLEKYAPDETAEDPKTWLVWDKLRPHAEALVAIQRDDDRVSPSLALLIALGQLYYGKGLYSENVAVDEAALALAERKDGLESKSVASRLLAYGETLRMLARYPEAESAFARSLAIAEEVDGPDSMSAASHLNYLALAVGEQGKLREADDLLRKALIAYEAEKAHDTGAFDDDGYVKLLANLGAYAELRGDPNEAERFIRMSIAHAERTLGEGHPRTLLAFKSLATLLRKKGDLDGAEILYRRVLGLYEKTLGSSHPQTIEAIAGVAATLSGKGDHETASAMFRQAVEASRASRGDLHPDTLSLITGLASVLEHKHDYHAAEHFYLTGLRGEEKVLGKDHPITLITANNLSGLYSREGRNDEAELLLRQVVDTAQRVLGREHPHTLSFSGNLASLLSSTGRTAEALQIRYEILVQRRSRAQAQPDPDLARAANNLSHEFRKLGEPDKAEALAREALELDQSLRDPRDPVIPNRLQNLAIVLLMQGTLADARNTLAEAWALETDGPDLTGSRIVFLRLTAALMERESAGIYVGLLKTLFAVDTLPNRADVQETWDIDYFIPYVLPRIGDSADFLVSVIAAMNDRSKRLALDAYPRWTSQPALPLDTPWPSTAIAKSESA